MKHRWVIASTPGGDMKDDKVQTLPDYLVGAVEGAVVSGSKQIAILEKAVADAKADFWLPNRSSAGI